MSPICILVIYFSTLVDHSFSGHISVFSNIKSLTGYVSEGTQYTTDGILCVRLCLKHGGCSSFFEHYSDQKCKLETGQFSSEHIDELIQQDGWKYYVAGNSACNTSAGYIYDITSKLCFKYFDELLTYPNVEARCLADGGRFLQIRTEEQQKTIGKYMVQLNTTVHPRVAGTRLDNASPWMFGNTEMTFFKWGVKNGKVEPLDNKHCIKLSLTELYLWRVAYCHAAERFFCELVVN